MLHSEKGSYLSPKFISEFYVPFLDRRLRAKESRRFHGLNLIAFPAAKRLIYRGMNQGFAGEIPRLPKAAVILDEFMLFLRQQVAIMATQAQFEVELEMETEETEHVKAEGSGVTVTAPEERAPDWVTTYTVQPEEFALPQIEYTAIYELPFLPNPMAVLQTEALIDVALTKVEEQAGSITETVVRRKRNKPQKPTAEAMADVTLERSLPRLEVPREDVIRLMELFTPTDWHAKLIRRQVNELQRLTSDAAFDRILQSVYTVLTSIQLAERAQDTYHGRHLKSLSQKGLWQIKPQGRTPVRIILGLGDGGYHLLRILPRAKNNASLTNRQLNSLAEEYAGLK